MTQQAFFFDESRCLDCRACSIACQDWNDIQVGTEKFLRRFTWEEGLFPEIKMHFVFAPCYHCEDPACIKACAEGAIFKEPKYGAVLVDESLCTGCKSCWEACPYGAPRFDANNKMKKCTMCIDRLDKGLEPACVDTCITRALDFGPVEEMEAKYGTCRALDSMPRPDAVKPAIVFKAAEDKIEVVPYNADKARKLFGYSEADFKAGAAGVFKNKLDMKIENPLEELDVMRSDEC